MDINTLMKTRPTIVMSFMGDDLLGTPKADGSLEWPSRVQAWINRRFARRMDSVIVKSAEMAGKISNCPSHVIPNGVDISTFRPLSKHDARSQLNWEQTGRYVLFLAILRIHAKGMLWHVPPSISHKRESAGRLNWCLVERRP